MTLVCLCNIVCTLSISLAICCTPDFIIQSQVSQVVPYSLHNGPTIHAIPVTLFAFSLSALLHCDTMKIYEKTQLENALQ